MTASTVDRGNGFNLRDVLAHDLLALSTHRKAQVHDNAFDHQRSIGLPRGVAVEERAAVVWDLSELAVGNKDGFSIGVVGGSASSGQ